MLKRLITVVTIQTHVGATIRQHIRKRAHRLFSRVTNFNDGAADNDNPHQIVGWLICT